MSDFAHGSCNPGQWGLTFFLTLIAIILVALCISTSSSGESERVKVTGIDGDLLVHPGQNARYNFSVKNNATVSDRYLLEIALEYAWEGEVISITSEANGEPVSFIGSETGMITTTGLPAGKGLLVEIMIHIPMLGGDEDWNTQNGLMSGSYCTISLWASSMSDDFTSKGTDKFEARMAAHHNVALEAVPDTLFVTTVGEESERIANYALKATYLSNDGNGDVVFLDVSTEIPSLWNVFLGESVFFSPAPGMTFNTSLSVVAPVGEEWTPEPLLVGVRGEVTSGNGSEVTTRTYLKKTGRASLFVENDTVICNPGEQVKHPLSIQNLGNAEDSFAISIMEGEESHWIILESNLTEPVQPFDITEFFIYILVPTEGAPPYGSTMNFTISATSDLSKDGETDSITLKVVVGIRRNSSMTIFGDTNGVVLPGKNLSFESLMTNTGNLPEELYVSMEKVVDIEGIHHESRADDWGIESSLERRFLQIGESVDLTITILAPDNALMGERLNVTIRAVPTLSNMREEEFQGINISVVTGNLTEIHIIPLEALISAGPNETVRHTLIIQNKSDHNITLNNSNTKGLDVNISFAGEGKLDHWVWMPSNLSIRPYSSSRIYLFTRIPPRALADTDYGITIAIEGYYRTSTDISLRVSQAYEINIHFPDTSHKIIQGRKTSYTLVIENLGNGVDVVELSVKNSVDYWRTSLRKTSLSIGAFTNREISVDVFSPSQNQYHGNPGEYARFLINATSKGAYSEVYTPNTYLSFIGVDSPSSPMDSYYTFDPNLTNDSYRLGTIQGYCYGNKTITYEFTFMNLGEGDDTEFIIPDISSPSYMDISVTMGNGVGVSGSFKAQEYLPIPLKLHIRINPITEPPRSQKEPIIFRISSPSSSNSILIYTRILYLDLFFQKVDIPSEVHEGKEVEVCLTVKASFGLFEIDSGYDGIDLIRNLKIVGYFDGKRILSHTIERLRIGEGSDIKMIWRIQTLRWNEKEKEDDLIIKIEEYSTYQGEVEQYRDNNQRKNKVVVRDAYMTDQANMDAMTSFAVFLVLLVLGWLVVARFGGYLIKKEKTDRAFFLLFALLFALMWGSIFNLPWHYLFGDGNWTGLFLSYLTLFVIFPLLLILIARKTRSYPIVEMCALMVLPFYLIAVSAGAGIEAVEEAISSSMVISGFGFNLEFPVVYIIPFYLIIGWMINHRMVSRYNLIVGMIKDVRQDLLERSMEARRKYYA